MMFTKSFRPMIRCFKRVKCYIKQTAIIAGSGSLYLGSRWEGSRYYPSELKLHKGACFLINGTFTVFSGSKIVLKEDAKLEVGRGYISGDATIHCFKSIRIGNDVAISKGVTIIDSDSHCIDDCQNHTAPIVIGDRVWIGMNVTILKGVTIGDGAIIGTGAIVTKNIPPRSLAVGIPAKVIKQNVSWK